MRYAVWLIEQPRWFKRMLLIANDMAMLSIALWSAYSLRLSELYVPENLGMWLLMAAAPIIGVITFHIRGLYKLVTRFMGPEGTTRIYIAVVIAVLAWAALVLMSGIKGHPRSVVVIYGLIAVGLIRLSRQWAASLLLRSAPKHKPVSFDERKNFPGVGSSTGRCSRTWRQWTRPCFSTRACTGSSWAWACRRPLPRRTCVSFTLPHRSVRGRHTRTIPS